MEKFVIPDKPFRMIISGRSGCGKTTLMMKLIKPSIEMKRYDEIVIVCPSYSFDPAYNMINSHGIRKMKATVCSKNLIRLLLKVCQIKKKRLIIFDDCMGTEGINSREFQKLIIMARHLSTSIIATTQKVTGMPTTMRTNTEMMIAFKTDNEQEIKTLYDNFGDKTKKDFKKRFEAIGYQDNAYVKLNGPEIFGSFVLDPKNVTIKKF